LKDDQEHFKLLFNLSSIWLLIPFINNILLQKQGDEIKRIIKEEEKKYILFIKNLINI
jgi:hypothetical protein